MSAEPAARPRDAEPASASPPANRQSAQFLAGSFHATSALARAKTLSRLACSAALIAITAFGVQRYPLSPWVLVCVLAAYAGLLCYRPVSFLLILPIVLPAADLGLWTGWMMVGESDFFVLITLAVLLIRNPPQLTDLAPPGLPRAVLLALALSWCIAVCSGLFSPLGAPHSDNPFLRPDNALRLAKGLLEALLLLPFLRQRQRINGDAVTWFARGMAAGIIFVTIIVLAERALFIGILDTSATYRVAGPFSSMRVGGGHIGAYIALALPFALSLAPLRPRWIALPLLLLTCAAGGYTLVVTFARTAYAAGLLAMTVAGALWILASRSQRKRPPPVALVPILLVAGVLAAMLTAGGMHDRMAASSQDFQTRRENWQAGLAVRDTGPLPTLFGMGLGTYQRAMLMRSPVNRPSDLMLERAGQEAYVSMRVESPFFLGQKILAPPAGALHLFLLARTPDDATTLDAAACDKVLLYSDNCRGGRVTLNAADGWRGLTFTIPTDGLGSGFGWLRRPVELSLFGGPPGHQVDLRDIRLTSAAGQNLLANGNFEHGLDRWIFTDDSHIAWRMLNQYLMLWFETGAFGLAAYLALAALSLLAACKAASRGDITAASVAGSVTGFMVSGLFDNLLEAPRIATLFFLVCLCGLISARPSGHVRNACKTKSDCDMTK